MQEILLEHKSCLFFLRSCNPQIQQKPDLKKQAILQLKMYSKKPSPFFFNYFFAPFHFFFLLREIIKKLRIYFLTSVQFQLYFTPEKFGNKIQSARGDLFYIPEVEFLLEINCCPFDSLMKSNVIIKPAKPREPQMMKTYELPIVKSSQGNTNVAIRAPSFPLFVFPN